MAAAREIATRYFEAIGRHDLDAAASVCKPGATDRLVGDPETAAAPV